MIRYARNEDYDSIVRLWHEAFGDDDFSKWYFNKLYDEKNTLIYEENGLVVAKLSRISYEIENLGMVTYIYGACTDIRYRGQGIMKKLLEYSEEIDRKNGNAAVILIPENDSLFSYYEKCGFSEYFYKYFMDENVNYGVITQKKCTLKHNIVTDMMPEFDIIIENKNKGSVQNQ